MNPALANRRWRYRAATFRRRLVADLLDALLIASTGIVLWRTGLVAEPLSEGPGDLLDRTADTLALDLPLLMPAVVAVVVVALVYGALTRAVFAGTLGERALGLRLLDPSGAPAGPTRAALHGLAQLAGLLLLGLGYTWALVDSERRTLAEHLTGARLAHGRPEPEVAGRAATP